jgi:hypothetical protein
MANPLYIDEALSGGSLIRHLLFAFGLVLALLAATEVRAAQCDLQMVATCTSGGSCTSSTTNVSKNSCSGQIFLAWFVDASQTDVTFSELSTSLGNVQCLDTGDFGGQIPFPFVYCIGHGSISPGDELTTSVRISGASTNVAVTAETAVIDDQTDDVSIAIAVANADVPTCKSRISAPALAQSGSDYTVSWSEVRDSGAQFIIEESITRDFTANVTSAQVAGTSKVFRHEVSAGTLYYYRVKPTRCVNGTPEVSEVAVTTVQPSPPLVRDAGEAAVPLGSTTPIRFQVFIPGAGPNATFEIVPTRAFLTVTPASGPLPPAGVTVTVFADPSGLPPGASTSALRVLIQTPNSAGSPRLTTHGDTTLTIPITVSLVTPVQPGVKTLPPANALVIPVVTHVQGGAGPFLSDVRLTNSGAAAINYQITFTPTETDGTKVSKITQVTVAAQQTVALNDVVKNFFGLGATAADSGFGALEIRPLNTSSAATFASSRLYASTSIGTFGQFIAAVPFRLFATKRTSGLPLPGDPPSGGTPTMSLQQVAQSTRFRTNLGLAEGAGEPANGRIRVFNNLGAMLSELPYSLQPGEHKQMNLYISSKAGISNLEDGRIEVTVDSSTGAVTAYASVLDNVTTDPLAVMPVEVAKVSASRYVLPGMADLPGDNNFHSDIRVYNGGASAVTANFTYYPQGNGTPVTAPPRSIPAGQVLAIDNVLPAMFNQTSTGGSIVITTSGNTSLVATGRTYTNVAGGGTYGQFIPGVTPAEGTGLGERALQVLQLEQSEFFRSNLGLAELTGNSATIRISANFPDSIATPSTTLTLAPNEFPQLGLVLNSFAPGAQTFNGRITVEVIAGSGRVTAYASVIDGKSKDPTYVPAQ